MGADAEALAGFPAAPWVAPGVVVDDADVLAGAWRAASNRDWCAPVSLADTDGAQARQVSFEGGWAVEFDKRGLPGVSRSGRACQECGRSAFGIAGTSILVDDEADASTERVAWSDGSSADLELGDGAAVATLKIRGQQCVYQVWSMAGKDHLKTLLDGLRFVDAD